MSDIVCTTIFGLAHNVGHLVVGFLSIKIKIIISVVYNEYEFVFRIVAHLMINP